jgi:hypothetical protein
MTSIDFLIPVSTCLMTDAIFMRLDKRKLTRQNGQLAQQNQQLNKALLWQQSQLALLGQDVFQSSR